MKFRLPASTAAGAPPPAPSRSNPEPGGKPPPPRPIFWRLLLVAITAGWLLFFFLHPADLIKVGVHHFRVSQGAGRIQELWFYDMSAILASNDAVAAGRDPYAPNPFDFRNREHVYGPWWLELHQFGLTRRDNLSVGLALGGLFLVVVLLWLRPRDLPSLLWSVATLCTTPVLLALERANNDLVIFLILMPVVPCLLARRPLVRWFAVMLIAVAADLKFYPAAALLVLLAADSPRELRWRIASALVVFALVGWHLSADFVRVVGLLPIVEGIFSFGAVAGLHELGWQGPWPQLIASAAGVAVLGACWRIRWLDGWTPAPAQRREWLYFVLGAALLTGCFFTAQNHDYRWIFALWLTPLLWSLSRGDSAPIAVRRLARVTSGLLLTALWFDVFGILALRLLNRFDPLSALHWIFLVEQPLTWALFVCLMVFLVHFARGGLRTLLTPR